MVTVYYKVLIKVRNLPMRGKYIIPCMTAESVASLSRLLAGHVRTGIDILGVPDDRFSDFGAMPLRTGALSGIVRHHGGNAIRKKSPKNITCM